VLDDSCDAVFNVDKGRAKLQICLLSAFVSKVWRLKICSLWWC